MGAITILHVIPSQCAHWRGNPFSLRLKEPRNALHCKDADSDSLRAAFGGCSLGRACGRSATVALLPRNDGGI